MATRYIDSYCFAIRRWTFVRRRLLWTFLPTILLAIPLYYHCSGSGSDQDPPPKSDPVTQQTVHLAVVACDQRLEEALMMVKSAVTFGRAPLHVHVFTDSNLWWTFSESLQNLQTALPQRSFSFTVYLTSFPVDHADEWRQLFKPCACQRLFLPGLLTSIDSLIYVDTDILFLRPPEDLWAYFDQFNSSHIAAVAPEGTNVSTSWYVYHARHPFYNTHLAVAINSGVMLMNLTRMREFRWSDHLTPVFLKYRHNTSFGDQDLINIIFSLHPEKLHIFGCEWNYRSDHCSPTPVCPKAEDEGASVLHGSRGSFHWDDYIPAFKAVYDSIKRYTFGSDLESNLLEPLQAALTSKTNTTCGAAPEVLLKQIQAYVRRNRE